MALLEALYVAVIVLLAFTLYSISGSTFVEFATNFVIAEVGNKT